MAVPSCVLVRNLSLQREKYLSKKTKVSHKSSQSLSIRLVNVIDFFETQSRAFHGTKALPCASLTVESAFVLPICLFALLLFLGIFPALQVEAEMNEALQYTARQLAVTYAAETAENLNDSEEDNASAQDEESSVETGLISSLSESAMIAAGQIMVQSYLEENGCWTKYIADGMSAVSFADSVIGEEYVDLCVQYRISLPIAFWGYNELPVTQRVCARKWIGYEGTDGSDADWVYVTETGTAYHTSTSCSYLDLSIEAVDASRLSELRNRSGAIYYACDCCNGEVTSGTVYITDYGTRYHTDLSCSGLKRTIYKIKLENVGSRHACSKCAA